MNYDVIKQKARAKLSAYGSTATITRKGERVYNTETHSYSSTDVFIVGCGILQSIDISKVNGTTILAGDCSLMCSFDESPIIGDSLVIGNKKYTVVNVSPLSPNGLTNIYYDLHIR